MIRLRCETGLRPRHAKQVANDDLIPPVKWTELALSCARLQAKAVIGMGRKVVPLEWIADQNWGEGPRSLYAAGILELLSWDEHTNGRLRRIRRVDLSLAAAEALLQCGSLPRCFLPILLAQDLLTPAGMDVPQSGLIHEEFAAWIECDGWAEQTTILATAA